MAASEEGSSRLATAKVILSATASFTATLLVVRSLTRDLLPEDIQDNLTWVVRKFCARYFSSKLTIVIEEFEGLEPNKLYEAVSDYLATKISPSTDRIRVSRHEKEARLNVSVEPEQEIEDVFDCVKVKWELVVQRVESKQPGWGHRNSGYGFGTSETRYFVLTFNRKHKDVIIDRYLPCVEERAKEMRQQKKTLKLFTVNMESYGNLSDVWTPVNLDHPSTFDTLAMDSRLKATVLEDLERFVRRKEYYRRVGKAWKRGYLLYGPPGTGKSSLIAAMANYLRFDVYDLELTGVEGNWDLRKALVATANRSILVVEDIDCTLDFSERSAPKPETAEPSEPRHKKVTLSGLLNFIDGLWSSCGDERIIIFTTNHKEKLDPALLRPGRMDMHVHMSYCTPCGFRLLASNYLGVKHHPLFGEIEDMIRVMEVTPAEVAEELMKSDDPEKAFRDVIEFLKAKEGGEEEGKGKGSGRE